MTSVLRKITNRSYNNTLLGESLEDLARKATAKTLSEPDPSLIEAFVEAANSLDNDALSKDLVEVLKRRLKMDNAHKQWLAVPLVAAVLTECRDRIPTLARKEILSTVSEVATKPATKAVSPSGEPVSACMRKAKQAAFQLLRDSGGEGQAALRTVAGIGGAAQMQVAMQQAQMAHQSGASGSRSWAALSAETTNCIQVATGHVELVQELLLGDGGGDFEDGLIQDLMSEMLTFSAMFEPLLAQLASVDSPEAEALMAQALEAYDSIGSCQQLHTDVLEARQATQSGGGEAGPPATAPVVTPSLAPAAVPVPVAQAPPGSDPFDMLGLGELQLALDTSQATPAQSVDPFAYPTQQQQQQQQQQVPPSASYAGDAFMPTPASHDNEDPFLALATGGGTVSSQPQAPPPESTQHHLSPDSLLADLTKSPQQATAAPAGMAMRAAPAAAPQILSANNPFAEPAAAAPAPPAAAPQQPVVSQSSVDDEWDMFFKDRVASPPAAVPPTSGVQPSHPADAFDALVMQ